MAEFPCLPLFTDAYLGDTTHLNTTEHGAYLLLLIAQWRSHGCALPNDDNLLSRYAKMTIKEWVRIRPILEPFFMVTITSWCQKRLRDEKKFVESKRQQNISAGKVSALKRKDRHSTDVITDVPTDGVTEGQQKHNQPLTLNPHPSKDTSVSLPPISPKGDFGFSEWYSLYPNKVGKADAKKKFLQAIKKASLEILIQGLERYIHEKPPDRPWCNPATWLHQERWTDQPQEIQNANQLSRNKYPNEKPSNWDKTLNAIEIVRAGFAADDQAELDASREGAAIGWQGDDIGGKL